MENHSFFIGVLKTITLFNSRHSTYVYVSLMSGAGQTNTPPPLRVRIPPQTLVHNPQKRSITRKDIKALSQPQLKIHMCDGLSLMVDKVAGFNTVLGFGGAVGACGERAVGERFVVDDEVTGESEKVDVGLMSKA